MRTKWWALMAVAALGVTACSSSHKRSAPTNPSTTSVPSAVTTATTAPAVSTSTTVISPSSTSTSSSSTAPSGPQPCQTASLAGSLGQANGAAGTIYYPLVLRNTGASACTLYGYAGVSFVTGQSGQQVGAPADHRPGTLTTLTLAPGQSAQATLGITDAGNFSSSCQSTAVAGLRVYPPNQTAALYIPHSDHACANPTDVTLHVGPMTAA